MGVIWDSFKIIFQNGKSGSVVLGFHIYRHECRRQWAKESPAPTLRGGNYEAEKGDTPPSYAATKQVLSDYFFPRKKNPQTEVYKFRNCKENPSQS